MQNDDDDDGDEGKIHWAVQLKLSSRRTWLSSKWMNGTDAHWKFYRLFRQCFVCLPCIYASVRTALSYVQMSFQQLPKLLINW